MSDTSRNSDGDTPEVDATGVDADFVTNDHDPEPDRVPGADDAGEEGDDVEVADLP